MNARTAIAGFFMAGTMLPLAAGEKLIMRVSPEVSVAPARVTIRATIDSDPANRALEVAVESDDFYRSSVITLDGERAPRTSVVEFSSLPSGQYSTTAALIDSAGARRAVTEQKILVLASGER